MSDNFPFENKKSLLKNLFDLLYIFSPILAFIPQIRSKNITYDSTLSLLTIFTNILKLFPTKNSIDTIVMYQFVLCIALHIFLLNIKAKQSKLISLDNQFLSISNVLLKTKYFTQWIVGFVSSFVLILKVLEFYGLSEQFLKISIFIDILIAILHVKIYSKDKKKPVELFAFWIVGDLIRLYIMYTLYNYTVEYYLGVFGQLFINSYVLIG